MSFESAVEYLYGLQKFGMKFGLTNIRTLLSELGDPHRSFLCVHVAGTNGKGSTCMFIESILRTSGKKTGLFTSPHLVSFTERIRINGMEISEEEVIALAGEVRAAAEGIKDFSPTFFEVVSAMAFLHFKRQNVDWAVIEVGMGGRLDATNIIMPEASVITPVSMDHREFLGRNLTEIAGEKAGIIKGGVPVITSSQPAEVMEVIEAKCRQHHAPLFRCGSEFTFGSTGDDPDNIIFDYRGASVINNVHIPLAGQHQIENASTAIKCAEVISSKMPGLVIDVRKGVKAMKCQGRAELLRDDPPTLIDGAHNPAAAEVLGRYLRKKLDHDFRRIILVLGIMSDKDITGILRHLLPLAAETICTSPGYGRAATPEVLAAESESLGYRVRKAESVRDALRLAEDIRLEGDLIVVTGSFYTTGETKELLSRKGVLANLRE